MVRAHNGFWLDWVFERPQGLMTLGFILDCTMDAEESEFYTL